MTILTALLEATLGAWLIAGLIGLIRLCFRRVLSPKAKYYLWALLALRLMLPVLPESPLSLMNFLPQRETAGVSETETNPVANDPVWLETAPEAAPVRTPSIAAPLMEQDLPAQTAPGAPDTVREEPAPVTWQQVLLWVWLGGMGVTLLVYLALYAVTARQLRRLPCVTDPDTLRIYLKLKRDLGIRGKVNLVSGGGGMLGGILRPTIVIPAELHGQEVAPILIHELLHYKYRDLWVSLGFRILTTIHWFNPVVWLCLRVLRNDSEAACDQRVLESGLVERERYATLLYEEGVLQMKNSILMQTTFGGDGRSLKRRIRLIARFRRPKVWMTVLTVVLALAVSACTLTGAQSDSASSAETAPPDFETYMADKEPPQGVFGLTFEEHVEQGLLDPDAGTLEHYTDADTGLTFSGFTTTMELGGETVEIAYSFGQSVLTDQETLKQVFVTLPEDVDPEDWLKQISDPWLSGLTRNTDYNGFLWEAPENVADFLTDTQLDTAAEAEVAMAQKSSSPEFHSVKEDAKWYMQMRWPVVRAFYQEEGRVWQFNGTGAALIAAANRNEPSSQPESASTEEPTNTEALTQTISPYVLSGDGVTYGNTQWGMTTDEVFTAEGLNDEAWCYVKQSKSIIPRNETVLNHPGVTDLVYYFNYAGPELEFGLNLVITRYNAQTVGFDQLVAQRTEELGTPGFQDETKASWEFPDGTALLLINDEKILVERLTSSFTQYADGSLQDLDVEAYMEELQAPNGHFGWTFQQHLDAGLMDPDGWTQESLLGEDGTESLYFNTTTELGGYEVPITYLFHQTLVSEEPVLTQVFVEPPEGVDHREWLESFYPVKNKLYEQSSLRYISPVMLSNVLPEHTRLDLIEHTADLSSWSLVGCWYEVGADFWQINGTGAALYLTATEAQ